MFEEFEDLFSDLFSSPFFKSNENTVEYELKRFENLQKKLGGEINTEYENVVKVKKTLTSKNGKVIKTFTYFAPGDVQETIELENLKKELANCIENQEFEKCAKLRDKITELKNKEKD